MRINFESDSKAGIKVEFLGKDRKGRKVSIRVGDPADSGEAKG